MTQHSAFTDVPHTRGIGGPLLDGVSGLRHVHHSWAAFPSSNLVLLLCVPQATPKEQ